MGVMAGLYRRVLPSPPAIDFASTEGKQLFLEAIQRGTMENFYRLISHFQTQSEPAYCGLASLSMVLNALAIDPGRTWKGPWRWFDETMLDCCEPLEKVKTTGISFEKLACLARCAGAKVAAFYANQSSIDDFRSYVKACSTSDDCHVISSYHRGIFKQTGVGHFSPIGGYHADKDMALILDVARFKYPPHWVPLSLLWEAMDTVANPDSGQRRGFMLISRHQREPALLYTLSCKHESWTSVAQYLTDDLPLLLKSEEVKSIHDILHLICSSLPSNFREFIKWVAEVRRSDDDNDQSLSPEEKKRLSLKEEILKQVRETNLYKRITKYTYSKDRCCNENPTLSSKEDNLTDVGASICSHGAAILSGNSTTTSIGRFCCVKTCFRSLKDDESNHGRLITMISGMVDDGRSERGRQLQALIPCCCVNKSSCCMVEEVPVHMYPVGNDVLTVLLLALPTLTWSGIEDQKLLKEISEIVSTDHLPILLQDEVLHLRRQLNYLKRWRGDKGDCDDRIVSSP